MIFDLVVLAILLVSALIAFMRGFIREVLTIAGVVGGLIAAYLGGPLLQPVMRGWFGVKDGVEPKRLFDVIPYSLLADILSYGLIFIVVVIILSIISHSIAEGARAIGLGPLDRTMGVIFGIVRGIFLLGLIYLPFSLVLDKDTKDTWFEGSKTFFYIEHVSAFLSHLIPEKDLHKLEKSAQDVEDASKDSNKDADKDESDDHFREHLLNVKIPDGAQAPADKAGQPGYGQQFRQELDQLFEKENNNPAAPPPQPQPAPQKQGLDTAPR